MARPKAAGFDAQRAAIRDAATRLFAAQGYASTSIADIAADCRVSKALLYHYYRDKDAMLVHIADGHVSRLLALVAEVQALKLTPEALLRELVRCIVVEYAGAQHAHHVLTQDVKFLPPADRRRILDKERGVVAAFAAAVAALRPELREAALATPLTMLLFGMVNWMFTWLKPEGALDYEALAPMVADLFLGGLPAVRLPQPAEALG